MAKKQCGTLPEFIYVRRLGEGKDTYYAAGTDLDALASEDPNIGPIGSYKLFAFGTITQVTDVRFAVVGKDKA